MVKQASVSSLIVRATLSFFAVVFCSAVPGAAQVYGAPSSVLSMGTTPRVNRMGVPASSTSTVTHGYRLPSCRRVFAGPGTFGHPDFNHGHDRFRHRFVPVVYTYYPYIQPPVYSNDESSQHQQQEESSAYQAGYERGKLESEIQQLRQQIADLKESQIQAARLPAVAEAQIAGSEPNTLQSQGAPLEPVAILVFRGGRTVELQNYAIANGSIWNLKEEPMEMFSTDDLDVEATRKLNESRGLSRDAAAILEAVNNVDRGPR